MLISSLQQDLIKVIFLFQATIKSITYLDLVISPTQNYSIQIAYIKIKINLYTKDYQMYIILISKLLDSLDPSL